MVLLFISCFDAQKRNALMVKLSESLELDFNKKNPENIKFPTLNFMCPITILSWVEARKLSLTVGV